MPRLQAQSILLFVAAAAVSAAARRHRALSRSGAVAATAVGGVVATGVGLRGGAALVTFFLGSTLLGRLPSSRARLQQRGNERDAVQVFANGGVAALLAMARADRSSPAVQILLAGFGGALATATADTWATEIGSRSRHRPRSIVTGQFVPSGASGGVTWAGIAASAAGATTIGAIMSLDSRPGPTRNLPPMRAIVLGGFCGATVDSILGATAQEVRFCDLCDEETESRRHACGSPTRPVRGWLWCTNDAVNAIATALGAMAAMALTRWLPVERKTWRSRRTSRGG